jgi:hypothetical protein
MTAATTTTEPAATTTAEPAAKAAPVAHAYIATSNQEAVAEAAVRTLASVGGTKVSSSTKDSNHIVHVKHADAGKPEWTITIAAGVKGWTIIDTQPVELLAQHGNKPVPMLAEICRRSRARGFLFVTRSIVDAVLIEADAWGEFLLSGCVFDEADEDASWTFYGNPMSADRVDVRFEIVPIQFDILDMDDYLQLGAYLRKEIGGREWPATA